MAFGLCSLTSVKIPNSVTNIADSAFAVSSLTSVIVPNSVIGMGNYTFFGCDGLTNAVISESVTNIGVQEFYDCVSLNNVVIPPSVNTLASDAFSGCSSLTYVCFQGNAPQDQNGDVFSGDPLSVIHYVNGSSGWGTNYDRPNIPTSPCAECQISVPSPPFIDSEPTNIAVSIGGAGQFVSDVTCESVATCYWYGPETNLLSTEPFSGKFTAILNIANCALTNSGTYFCVVSNSYGSVTSTKVTLTTAAVAAFRITSDQANIHNTDNIDAPIVPASDVNTLAGADTPLGKGVVADEVTPVLFQIVGTPGGFTLGISNTVLTYTNGPLRSRLFVLTSSGWQNTTNITLSPSSTDSLATNYAYLEGLRWMDFTGTATEITATVGVQPVGYPSLAHSSSFNVRPPPVVLIHGIADDASTWSSGFLAAFSSNWPTDFVVPIQYGVGNPGDNNNWPNTAESLTFLAGTLEYSLEDQFENVLHPDWAFTRYDVVGHSQGGVLARMLCQTCPPFNTPPFGVSKGVRPCIMS
jgi:hypothetical protein